MVGYTVCDLAVGGKRLFSFLNLEDHEELLLKDVSKNLKGRHIDRLHPNFY